MLNNMFVKEHTGTDGLDRAKTSSKVDPMTMTFDPEVIPHSLRDLSSLASPFTITFCISFGTPT